LVGHLQGEWHVDPASFAPVVEGRSGQVVPPFDKPSPSVEPLRFSRGIDAACALLDTGARRTMSGPLVLALRERCNGSALIGPSENSGEAAGASTLQEYCFECGSTLSCPVPPESNPPQPPTVNGFLANNLSRQLQTDEIRQSETSIAISSIFPQQRVTAYNNFLTRLTHDSGVGFSRQTGTSWSENSAQLAIPRDPLLPQWEPLADPSLAVGSDGVFHLAYLMLDTSGSTNPFVRIAQSGSVDGGQTFSTPEHVIVPAANFVSSTESVGTLRLRKGS
jgi:hypothetical protein